MAGDRNEKRRFPNVVSSNPATGEVVESARGARTCLFAVLATLALLPSCAGEVGIEASEPFDGDTSDRIPPAAPSNLVAAAASSSAIDLTWTAATDDIAVTGYLLERAGTQIASLGASATGFQDSGLTASTAFTYSLKAMDAAGNLSAAATASATTSGAVCVPNCSGKACGSDSCGGSCGTCGSGTCTSGQCVAAPVNGHCGSANGVSVSSAPTGGLCSAGTASAVTGSGPWSWSCAGSSGGDSASCSAPLASSSSSAFPSSSNTGVPAGTALTKMGSITITTPGYVLQNVEVDGCITIGAGANNVTIRNVLVKSGGCYWLILNDAGATNLNVIDTELDGLGSGSGDAAVGGRNYTLTPPYSHPA